MLEYSNPSQYARPKGRPAELDSASQQIADQVRNDGEDRPAELDSASSSNRLRIKSAMTVRTVLLNLIQHLLEQIADQVRNDGEESRNDGEVEYAMTWEDQVRNDGEVEYAMTWEGQVTQ